MFRICLGFLSVLLLTVSLVDAGPISNTREAYEAETPWVRIAEAQVYRIGQACLKNALALLSEEVAIFWQVENWRGRERWTKVEEAMASRGQSLDPWDYLPESVSDDLNAMRHPVWDLAQRDEDVFDLDVPRIGNEPTPDDPPVPKLELKPNAGRDEGPNITFFNPEPVFDAACEGLPESFMGKKVEPRLEHWHQLLQRDNNEFFGRDSKSAVLEVTKAYTDFSEGMDEAFRRPYAKWVRRPTQNQECFQWVIVDQRPVLAGNPLPQIPDFREQIVRLASVSQIRAVAHLANGNSEKAAEDLLAPLYLLKNRPNDWGQVMVLVRMALSNVLSEHLETVLVNGRWQDDDLRRIQAILGGLDLIKDLHQTYQVECAAGVEGIRFITSQPEKLYETGTEHQISFGDYVKVILIKNALPQGWIYQNMANKVEWSDEDYVQDYVPATKRLIARKTADPDRSSSLNPYTFLATIVHLDDSNFYQRAAETQTRFDLLSLLCALQRHHLEEDDYPTSLEELVPSYINELPLDYVTARVPHYERTENGGLALAALDWDQSNDPDQFLCRIAVD